MCAEKMEKLQSKSIRDRLSLWEGSLAPLSDSEKQGFMELGTIAAQRPLPPEVHNENKCNGILNVYLISKFRY